MLDALKAWDFDLASDVAGFSTEIKLRVHISGTSGTFGATSEGNVERRYTATKSFHGPHHLRTGTLCTLLFAPKASLDECFHDLWQEKSN